MSCLSCLSVCLPGGSPCWLQAAGWELGWGWADRAIRSVQGDFATGRKDLKRQTGRSQYLNFFPFPSGLSDDDNLSLFVVGRDDRAQR